MAKAKKRFGQNFLHDANIINRIIAAINPQAGEHLVEIGPGHAALTKQLISKEHWLDIIEIDRDLIANLEQLCQHYDNCRIFNADVLTIAFPDLVIGQEKLRVIGNLPYNISTPLLFHLVTYIDVIQDLHFMLQQEVVERIVAQPGQKAYGRLSVMMQYYFDVAALFTVSRHCFIPVPQVESAIIRLVPHSQKPLQAHDEKLLSEVVRLAFNQRRKTIKNSLKSLLSGQQLDLIGINPQARAENLWLKDYINISNFLYK